MARRRTSTCHGSALAALVLLVSLAPDFALRKQAPLSQNRARVGLGLHTKVNDQSLQMTASGKRLVSQITEAGRRGNWVDIRRLFADYVGRELPVYHAVMHGAYLCGQYEEGVRVYERLCSSKIGKHEPVYATAVRLFAKLGLPSEVEGTWQEAMSKYDLNKPLAAARIEAAAVEGDIQAAAQVLDDMKHSDVEIDVGHITSAIRACWEATGSTHHAADFLFDLLLDLELQPDIALYTCLIGAYKAAPVDKVVGAYSRMRELGLKADFAFAEIYLATLVLLRQKEGKLNLQEMIAWLREVPASRIAAAKAAVGDFKRSNIKLTSLSHAIERALHQL
eukprot:s2801_g2.t1